MRLGMWSARDLRTSCKHVHWAVSLFMSIIIALARDSLSRDFTLLGMLIVLVIVTEFRDYLAQYRS